MSGKTLEERLTRLPVDKWVDLNKACQIMETKSKSYLKMFLLAHPNVQWRRVENKESPIKSSLIINWKWQFRRIEETI